MGCVMIKYTCIFIGVISITSCSTSIYHKTIAEQIPINYGKILSTTLLPNEIANAPKGSKEKKAADIIQNLYDEKHGKIEEIITEKKLAPEIACNAKNLDKIKKEALEYVQSKSLRTFRVYDIANPHKVKTKKRGNGYPEIIEIDKVYFKNEQVKLIKGNCVKGALSELSPMEFMITYDAKTSWQGIQGYEDYAARREFPTYYHYSTIFTKNPELAHKVYGLVEIKDFDELTGKVKEVKSATVLKSKSKVEWYTVFLDFNNFLDFQLVNEEKLYNSSSEGAQWRAHQFKRTKSWLSGPVKGQFISTDYDHNLKGLQISWKKSYGEFYEAHGQATYDLGTSCYFKGDSRYDLKIRDNSRYKQYIDNCHFFSAEEINQIEDRDAKDEQLAWDEKMARIDEKRAEQERKNALYANISREMNRSTTNFNNAMQGMQAQTARTYDLVNAANRANLNNAYPGGSGGPGARYSNNSSTTRNSNYSSTIQSSKTETKNTVNNTQTARENEKKQQEEQRLIARKKAEDLKQIEMNNIEQENKENERKLLLKKKEQERKLQLEQEVRDKKRNEQLFFTNTANNTRLSARKCPDGEGKYYVVGIRPKRASSDPVSCIDVHYRASCPGSKIYVTGTGKNFLGAATDCFMGDAYKMPEKLDCEVKEVQVKVTKVTACS